MSIHKPISEMLSPKTLLLIAIFVPSTFISHIAASLAEETKTNTIETAGRNDLSEYNTYRIKGDDNGEILDSGEQATVTFANDKSPESTSENSITNNANITNSFGEGDGTGKYGGAIKFINANGTFTNNGVLTYTYGGDKDTSTSGAIQMTTNSNP